MGRGVFWVTERSRIEQFASLCAWISLDMRRNPSAMDIVCFCAKECAVAHSHLEEGQWSVFRDTDNSAGR